MMAFPARWGRIRKDGHGVNPFRRLAAARDPADQAGRGALRDGMVCTLDRLGEPPGRPGWPNSNNIFAWCGRSVRTAGAFDPSLRHANPGCPGAKGDHKRSSTECTPTDSVPGPWPASGSQFHKHNRTEKLTV